MQHKLGIVSVDELLRANSYLNFEQAKKIQDWVVRKYLSIRHLNIDIVEFNNVVLDAVIADDKTYDKSKGTILSYIKTSVNFEVVKLIQSYHKPTETLAKTGEPVNYDLPYNILNDVEIETLYMVSQQTHISNSRLTILKRIKGKLQHASTAAT